MPSKGRMHVDLAGHQAFLRGAEARIKGVLLGVKERTVREMAERAAEAILAGMSLEELDLADVASMEGVEEAIHHILSGVYRRARVEVRAEHERLYRDALKVHVSDKARNEGEDPTPTIAAAAAQKYKAEIERGVKSVAARIKLREGADLWRHSKSALAGLIFEEVIAPGRCRDTSARARGEEPKGTESSGVSGRQSSIPADPPVAAADCHEGQRRADEHVALGCRLGLQDSINEYQEALAICPGHVMAHFFLAQAFQEIGNIEAAVAEFSHAVRLSPRDPDCHWCLGEALAESGEREAAADEYARALTLAADDGWILEMYSFLDPALRSDVGRRLSRGSKKSKSD